MNGAGHRRVFISYAHVSAAHIEGVRQLWTLLRANGVDARLDLPATAQRQDWPLWMLDQFRQADYVVVVASAAYRKRADGEVNPDEGRGVQFEGAVLRELFYADCVNWTERILPVVLPGESLDGIPLFLGPHTATSYRIKEMSIAGIEELLRVITQQPAEVEPPLGRVPVLASTAGPPTAPGPTSSIPADVTLPIATPGSSPQPDGSHQPLDELSALADAFSELPEFATAPGRYQAILLLPPNIRGAVNDAPNARLHNISIVQACARFGMTGRNALLDIMRAVLPADDPAVQRAITLIQSATLFHQSH